MKIFFINFKFYIYSICIAFFSLTNCNLDDLKGSCDTTSSKYLETSVILSLAGQRNNPCGGALFSTSDSASVNNTLLPEISPAPGRFYYDQEVSIVNPNENANICYTVDGSSPSCRESSCQNGTLYNVPILISSSLSVKAISCKSGHAASSVAISDFIYVTQYIYVANSGSANVSVLKLNPKDGSLLFLSSVPASSNPTGIGMVPGFGYAYVTTNASILNQYRADLTTGLLNTNGTNTSGLNSENITIDPKNRFAYVMNAVGTNISLYSMNQTTGTLTANGSSPTAFNLTASVIDPEGNYLYAIDSSNNLVNQFTINQVSGALSLTTSNTTGTSPSDIKIHPTGNFVFISNGNGQSVTCYQKNNSSGFLAARVDVTIDSNPNLRGMVIAKNGKYGYIVGNFSNLIYQVSINSVGIVSVVQSYTSGGSGTEKISIDESGNFLFATNYNSNSISTFRISQTDGSLSFIGNSFVGTQPVGIAIGGF